MAKRYKNLDKDLIYGAFDEVRNALLAAKDGHEVEDIMEAILSLDERIKIGRRVEVAYMIKHGFGYDEIIKTLRVGKATISRVDNLMEKNEKGFDLIFKRSEKVNKDYQDNAYRKVGGSKLLFKKREYTGFTRKDVPR